MEVLVGIVVVHILGHVELHALHQVHQLHKHLQIHLDVEVRGKAHQGFDPLEQGVDAVAGSGVDRVDLLDVPAGVDHGVPGDAHDADVLIDRVVAGDHDGVRIAVVHVGAHEKEGKDPILPFAGDGGHVAHVSVVRVELVVCGIVRLIGDGIGLVRLGRLDLVRRIVAGQRRRLDPQLHRHNRRHGDYGQTSSHGHKDLALSGVPESAPAGAQSGSLRRLLRPSREGIAHGGGRKGVQRGLGVPLALSRAGCLSSAFVCHVSLSFRD